MWDMLGLECLYDVDLHMSKYNEWEKQKVVAILKEERTPDEWIRENGKKVYSDYVKQNRKMIV